MLICAEKWINTARVPLSIVQSLPIYNNILETLQSQRAEDADNFEAAVDAILAVLYNSQADEQILFSTALPVILSLRKKWVGYMILVYVHFSSFRIFKYNFLW